ncbi:MAG: GIY-YIG nuclease family protein [Bacteroidia bacterium]|nr:GIY-YIG nuclease family protein [Bacteroidia bacterium]
MIYYVYVLFSHEFNRYYIGQSHSLKQRLFQHNNKKVKSTAAFCPWRLVGYVEKSTRSESMILERKLKNLNRKDLQKFVKKYFPDSL